MINMRIYLLKMVISQFATLNNQIIYLLILIVAGFLVLEMQKTHRSILVNTHGPTSKINLRKCADFWLHLFGYVRVDVPTNFDLLSAHVMYWTISIVPRPQLFRMMMMTTRDISKKCNGHISKPWDLQSLVSFCDQPIRILGVASSNQTWVCLKIGYIPNYSHLIGIMIINHWV